MLDIQYYTLKMDDELKGATEYIQRAINCKKSKPDHAKLYVSMSDGELEHASNLMKMFTAIIVAIFLAVPYLKGQRKSSFSRAARNARGEGK